MPTLSVPVDEDLAARLAREADRRGFDDAAAYVAWVLRRRATRERSPDDAATSEFTPVRVARPADGAVATAATRLDDVRRERFATAHPALAPGDDRPGADLADLDALDLPGHDADRLERRRRLVGAAVAHLADAGEARRGEFVAALREDRPAGYDSVDGWWGCLKRGLRQVARVRNADASTRTWRFRDVRGRVHVTRD
jgi:hypothetical protein